MSISAQEIFTAVWNHFVRDGGERSSSEACSCAYRGRDGAMCAVGVLLDDGDYDEAFEGVNVVDIRLPGHLKPHVGLLAELQGLHDRAIDTADVVANLRTFAASNTFNVTAPEQS